MPGRLFAQNGNATMERGHKPQTNFLNAGRGFPLRHTESAGNKYHEPKAQLQRPRNHVGRKTTELPQARANTCIAFSAQDVRAVD
jgi:hypothetical protein